MNDVAASTRLAQFRKLFPGAERRTYMDVAARGLLSVNVRAAIDRHLDDRMFDGGDKARMFQVVEEARARFASLIGADAHEIAFTRNVSDGVNAFAAALPWRAGDNVVLCEAIEHPANVFVWHGLARTRGITVKSVEPVGGRVPIDHLAAAMDKRTRVVAVSSVTFAPGLHLPLSELGRTCRERGVLLLVDAAQSIGVLRTDVAGEYIDALAVSTQKGLLGLYGMGFLHVRGDVAELLHPVYLSRFGVDLGDAHEAAGGDPAEYRLARAARRFDVGNYNYIGTIAVNQAMKDLQTLGADEVERHARGLAYELARRLVDLGLPVFAHPDAADLAHIVPVGRSLGSEHDDTDDPELRDLHRHLIDNGVRHTIRRGMLRLSLHAYNDLSDVERVVDLAAAWLRTRRPVARRIGTA